MYKACRIAVFVSILLAPLVAGAAPDTELGEELYAEYCAGCHGLNKSGLQNFALDSDAFVARLDGATDDMPDFAGFFEEDEIAALYAYLSATD